MRSWQEKLLSSENEPSTQIIEKNKKNTLFLLKNQNYYEYYLPIATFFIILSFLLITKPSFVKSSEDQSVSWIKVIIISIICALFVYIVMKNDYYYSS